MSNQVDTKQRDETANTPRPPAAGPDKPATGPQPDGSKGGSYFREHPGAKWYIVAGLLILATGGFLLWRHYSVRESTDDAQVDGYVYPVSARVAGHVVAVNVEDNQYVQAGAVLAQIDPRDYQIALNRPEGSDRF